MEAKNVQARLLAVQQDLKVPKNQYNSFGKYKYRSCEDILQAARPLCNSHGLILILRDTVEAIGNRFYIKAEAIVKDIDSGATESTFAYAREDDSKKGMDASQLTGATSSYARKYALCALFAIDDNKDADSDEYRQNAQNAPQAVKNSNPSTNTQKATFDRAQTLKKVQTAASEANIGNDEVKKIIAWKYQKDNSNGLSKAQLEELAANIANFYDDMKLEDF